MSLGFLSEWGAAAECRAARLWTAASRPARASPTHDYSPCRWLRSRSSPVRAEAGEGKVRKESRESSPASNRRLHSDIGDSGIGSVLSAQYCTRPPSHPVQLRYLPESRHTLTKQKRSSREGSHVVRQTLRSLLATLPLDQLQPSDQHRETSTDDVTQSQLALQKCASSSETADGLASRTSIAVQVSVVEEMTVKCTVPSSQTSETDMAADSDTCTSDPCKSPAWRQSVRALRDAHMRLARRHLRLLHTLSRELDDTHTNTRHHTRKHH